jgi:hypothetical protein
MGEGMGRIVVNSSITETEPMETFRPSVFWMKGRESCHQYKNKINRKD